MRGSLVMLSPFASLRVNSAKHLVVDCQRTTWNEVGKATVMLSAAKHLGMR